MAMKTWENNLEEIKILVREAKASCLNTLLLVYVEMDGIDLGDVHSIIGTLNINEKQRRFEEKQRKG